MVPWVAESAAVLIVGNELLSGKVHEGEPDRAREDLRALGVELRRVVMLPDDVEAVAREVLRVESGSRRRLHERRRGADPRRSNRGGHRARVRRGRRHAPPRLATIIQQAWGEACTEAHLPHGLRPGGRRARRVTRDGVADAGDEERVHPAGCSEAFRSKLTTVRRWVKGSQPFISKAVFTRLDESELKALLDAVVAAYPAVEVGSYPRWFEPTYKTKITFDGKDESLVESALRDFAARLPPEALVRVE